MSLHTFSLYMGADFGLWFYYCDFSVWYRKQIVQVSHHFISVSEKASPLKA